MPAATPDPDLPFLVMHASWIRWVVVAAGAAVGFALVVLVRRWLARRAARSTVRSMSALAGETVVRGVLRGDGTSPVLATVEGMIHGRGVRASWAAPAWIEGPDGRVDLEGDVHVIAGDRAYAARGRLPRETPEGVVAKLPGPKVESAHLVMLTPGTPVVASGDLVGAPDAQRLTNNVRIAAIQPRSAVTPLPIVAVVAIIAALGGLTLWLADRGGAKLLTTCREAEPDPERFVVVSETHPCSLGAALSGDGDRAVEAMTDMLLDHPYRDQRTFERLTALIAHTEGCEELLEYLWEHDRIEETLVHARACGDRRLEHEALVVQGRFAEAVAVPVDGTLELAALPRPSTTILAGAGAEPPATSDWILLQATAVEEILARGDAAAPDVHCAWFAPPALAAAPPASVPRAHALRCQTLAHVLDGDLDAAAATAREAATIAAAAWAAKDPHPDLFYLRDTALLPGVVAFRTASTDFEFPVDEIPDVNGWIEKEHRMEDRRYRFRHVLDRLVRDSDTSWAIYPEAYEALHGDGAALADEFGWGRMIDDIELLVVLPHVDRGRDALIRNLAWGRRKPGDWEERTPAEVAFHLALRRDLLRVAGLDDEAARWHSYYERYDAAMSDPRVASALYRLTP